MKILEKSRLAGEFFRTHFARMAPGLADGGATQLSGADHTGQLTGALAVVDASRERVVDLHRRVAWALNYLCTTGMRPFREVRSEAH